MRSFIPIQRPWLRQCNDVRIHYGNVFAKRAAHTLANCQNSGRLLHSASWSFLHSSAKTREERGCRHRASCVVSHLAGDTTSALSATAVPSPIGRAGQCPTAFAWSNPPLCIVGRLLCPSLTSTSLLPLLSAFSLHSLEPYPPGLPVSPTGCQHSWEGANSPAIGPPSF